MSNEQNKILVLENVSDKSDFVSFTYVLEEFLDRDKLPG